MAQTDQEPAVKRELFLLLAFAGGWVDAIGYLVLLKMFVAHMSGNSIGMTVALGQGHWADAFHRGFPIPLFVLGIALGSTASRILVRRGVRSVFALTLAVEALLLLLFVVLGSPLQGEEEEIVQNPLWRFYLLAALPALAMGLQNATLHRVGGSTIRTTYISGVLNSLSEELVKYLFGEVGSPGLVLLLLSVWLSYVAGGVAAILAEQQWRLWCLAIPIGCLLLVMTCDLVRPLGPGSRKEGG